MKFEDVLKKLEDHERRIFDLEKSLPSAGVPVDAVANGDKKPAGDLILLIINKVGDCKESEEIQQKVLDKKGADSKILLCFYIANKYFNNAWLTSGVIEKITSGLGVKIDIGYISNKIKGVIRAYLESGAMRKNGLPTPYRLNRSGIKKFEEILNAA